VLPPLALEEVPRLLEHLDGVCLSGGPDLDPAGYGDEPHPETGDTEPTLDAFELAVAQAADQRGMPLLGVCRGAQAMNIARGGTLFQHIPDVTDGRIDHRQKDSGDHTTHEITIEEGSRLAAITGATRTAVNSFHHQAIDRLGRDLLAVAWAPDGTVEAIEGVPAEPLFLGVQWHAESLVDRADNLALFRTLVSEASSKQTGVRAA
jgi:putative glutamine amidotransferase